MAGIKDAIVEILNDNADVRNWATGGIFARRAPQANSLRDRYIVVRVSDSDPGEFHTQDGAAQGTKDIIDVAVWCKLSRQADIGANLVREALDFWGGDVSGMPIKRIFWNGTVDREAEDARGSEQLIDGCHLTFEVEYLFPT